MGTNLDDDVDLAELPLLNMLSDGQLAPSLEHVRASTTTAMHTETTNLEPTEDDWNFLLYWSCTMHF